MIQSDARIGWQDYFAVIMRRRWHFTVPFIVILIGAMSWGLFQQKIYRAETLLMIQEQQVINPLVQGLAVSTPITERLRLLREELLSWTSLSRLSRELKLDRHAKSPLAFEQLIKRLQRDIRVGMRGRELITISFEDPDPVLAQQVVNTITDIYMQRNIETQTKETGTAISFLESEMAVYKKKLEESERKLREFKELYVMQMPIANDLNNQIVQMEVGLAQMLVENTEQHPRVIETRRYVAELKKRRNDEIQRVIVTALAKGADPQIYQDLAHALEEPSSSADTDPKLVAAKKAYHAWVERMDSATETPVAPNTQVQIVAAAGSPEQNSGELGMLGSTSTSLSLGPREEQELVRLTRDYQVYGSTYQMMQKRLEQAKVTQRLGESDEGAKFKVLEPARLPLKPVRPNLLVVFGFSLVLGIFVGAGVAFVAEYLDQSFQSADDVQAALDIPVLGSISTILTEQDLEARRRKRKGWVTFQRQLQLLKTYIVQPTWARLDRVLVRWGL